MGALPGTSEIVEAEEELGANERVRKYCMSRPGRVYSIEDDINQLFDSVNIKASIKGKALQKNPMKQPIRPNSPLPLGIEISESASLKQALRGLCISQASEMAALKKRSLKSGGSSRMSEAEKMNRLQKTLLTKAKIESVPSQEKIVPLAADDICEMSNTELVTIKSLRPKESLHGIRTVKHVLEMDDSSVSKEDKDYIHMFDRETNPTSPCTDKNVKNTKSSSSCLMRPVFRTKSFTKRKAKAESLSASRDSPTIKLEDKKLSKRTTELNSGNSRTMLGSIAAAGKGERISRSREKGEFSQSSKSSIGEYSTSTTCTSEESSGSGSSRCNRPHMSKDMKWEAVNCVQKQLGFLSLRHFKLLKRLGSGDIGTVYLAELVGSHCLFALKVMDNDFLTRRKKLTRAQTERETLQMLDHPFLPTLYAHFTTDKLSCLVMEYCPGGDLHVIRQKQPSRCFSEQATRFYVAEVLLALEYLHMLGIVYRDLKPENILVREDGHIMLSDFDLSLRCIVNPTLLTSSSTKTKPANKLSSSTSCSQSSCIDPFCLQPTWQASCFTPRLLATPSRTRKLKSEQALSTPYPQLVAEPTDARSNSFVGTHEYLAPEIVKGDGHGSAVDWWTYGIFLFELLYGKTPFKGSSNEDTLANVVSQPLKFPETPLVSFHAKDLIRCLLTKQPENRLGFIRGATEIKQHPFFEGLNWALIRCAVPPERPNVCDGNSESSSSKKQNGKSLGIDSSEHIEFELF